MALEYPSLLEAGFHNMTLDDLHTLFVAPFEESEWRQILCDKLCHFINKLKESGIHCEIWIDGSFTTEKPQPNDIDMAIFYNEEEVNTLPPERQEILAYLFEDPIIIRQHFSCDAYFLPNNDPRLRSYWRGWFGFSRHEKPTGIARLYI